MLIVGTDHRGEAIAKTIISKYTDAKYFFSNEYPDVVYQVSELMKENDHYCAFLICHSGVGMSIGINRYKYARAALVHTIESVKLAKQHNNINVICTGSSTIQDDPMEMIEAMFNTEFVAGRHAERLKRI